MKRGPTVELRLAVEEDRAELARMYAEHTRILHGFDETVVPGQVIQSDWWRKPDDLYPYLICHDGTSIGFCLVMGARYVAAVGEEGDYLIWELFVEEPYRGTGVAERVVREILASRPGRWSVQAMPANERAVGFWRRVTLKPPIGGLEGRNAAGFATFMFVAR